MTGGPDGGRRRQRSIVRFDRRPEAELRLLCVPGAGDRPNLFRSWQALVPDWVEVSAVQLPGHGARALEPPARRMAEIIDELARDVAVEVPGPLVIFGHSMGALVGFELAHRLEPGTVRQLIVAAHRAPHLPLQYPPVHRLDDDALIRWVDRLGGSRGGLAQDPELLALVLPVLRSDFELCDTYRCRHDEPLTVPIAAVGGHDDWTVTSGELTAWRRHTSAGFTSQLFDGGHFFFGEPPIADLMRLLNTMLDAHRRDSRHHLSVTDRQGGQ